MFRTALMIALTAAAACAEYRVVHGWPVLPESVALGQVTGVGLDSRNHVWVFHRGDRPVLCFDAETGKLAASWGEGLFPMAHGLTVDSRDNLWLTDVERHQVFKYNTRGELLMTLGVKGVPGVDRTHFSKPTDAAVNRAGEIYVTDGYGNSRVVKFSADGKYLAEWGGKGTGPGQFDTPHSITIDPEGLVYVADRGNARIQVFDAAGKFLRQFSGPAIGRPWGINLGADGFLYMVDGGDTKPKPPERNRALKLDRQGRVVEAWGSFGSYDGQFYWAHDIAVAPNGDAYVVDVNVGMRVQKFKQENIRK